MDDAIRQAIASRVGYDRAAIIDVNDPGYQLLADNFNVEVVAELETYRYHWNTQDKVATATAPSAGGGQEQYAGIITLDDGLINLHRIHQNGRNLQYDRVNKQVLLWSYNVNEDITLRGQWMCETQLWPELFRLAMIDRLAAILAGSLMQRPDVASYFENRSRDSITRLRGSDSQQQTNQRIRVGRIASARNTGYTSPRAPMGKASG